MFLTVVGVGFWSFRVRIIMKLLEMMHHFVVIKAYILMVGMTHIAHTITLLKI